MRVILLAARTARSQAYAQALANAGMTVDNAILMDNGVLQGRPPESIQWLDAPVFLPDLSIPLETTLESMSGNLIRLQSSGVNDSSVLETLVRLTPDLVIYSGYGGQLVGMAALGLGIPFLHCHSGLLPEFRGSTTIYYSILAKRGCGVSAIYLNEGIDMGAVVARRSYPLPPPGLDIDYIYDNAIRADLMLSVLTTVRVQGLPQAINQDEGEGDTYYVIHPVLKHLSILSLKHGDKPKDKGLS